jgi:hypothetical protein
MKITGYYVTVQNCGFWTDDGGDCGGYTAAYVSGGSNRFINNVIIDSDGDAIYSDGDWNHIIGNQVSSWDDDGIHIGASYNAMLGNILGGVGAGSFRVDSGANYSTWTGNVSDGGMTSDSGTGTQQAGNAQY